MTTTPHCGLIAILGAPNAGKSTLVNKLVGQKVAAVSAKEPLLKLAEELVAAAGFDEVFFISALTGDGVPELKARREIGRAHV